jgi:hypothetical protein
VYVHHGLAIRVSIMTWGEQTLKACKVLSPEDVSVNAESAGQLLRATAFTHTPTVSGVQAGNTGTYIVPNMVKAKP